MGREEENDGDYLFIITHIFTKDFFRNKCGEANRFKPKMLILFLSI
jgi:hypothetical protein